MLMTDDQIKVMLILRYGSLSRASIKWLNQYAGPSKKVEFTMAEARILREVIKNECNGIPDELIERVDKRNNIC